MVKTLLIVLVCCLGLTFGLAFIGEKAYAQDYMERKGLEGLFQGRKKMDGRGPTPVQKYVAIGSIFVMVAVVRFL